MKNFDEDKIVVVTRETRVDHLKKRFNTLSQSEFFVQSRGGKFADYQQEDLVYKSNVVKAKKQLRDSSRFQFIDRGFLPNFVFGPNDIVIAIGQDGLVANTLKYLSHGQPLIGVNPDPDRWDGVLLPFTVDELDDLIPVVLKRNHRQQQVTMGRAELNDGQELLAVNDFFIGQRTHVSARYMITSGNRQERHSSSGVIVSTGLGSTGWFTSLLQGATAISSTLSGNHLAVPAERQRVPWNTDKLFFTVREPFPSKTTQADLVFGEVSINQPLTIRSLMPENGVLFSDGVETDFIQFNSGAEVTIGLAPLRGNLVVR